MSNNNRFRFRAWGYIKREKNKMFYNVGMYGDGWVFTEGNGMCGKCGVAKGYALGDYGHTCELMQYTGLKDKNGKEIYEGDIVEFIGTNNIVKFGTYEDAEHCGHYGWYVEDIQKKKEGYDIDSCKYTMGNLDTYEIIGNIYENPELLDK